MCKKCKKLFKESDKFEDDAWLHEGAPELQHIICIHEHHLPTPRYYRCAKVGLNMVLTCENWNHWLLSNWLDKLFAQVIIFPMHLLIAQLRGCWKLKEQYPWQVLSACSEIVCSIQMDSSKSKTLHSQWYKNTEKQHMLTFKKQEPDIVLLFW